VAAMASLTNAIPQFPYPPFLPLRIVASLKRTS
jgi:hypothetical protein